MVLGGDRHRQRGTNRSPAGAAAEGDKDKVMAGEFRSC